MEFNLSSIPETVLLMTLSYLPLVNQISVTRVCGSWKQVIEDRIWPERKNLDKQDVEIKQDIFGNLEIEKHITEQYLPRFKKLKKINVSGGFLKPKIMAKNNPNIKLFIAPYPIGDEYRDAIWKMGKCKKIKIPILTSQKPRQSTIPSDSRPMLKKLVLDERNIDYLLDFTNLTHLTISNHSFFMSLKKDQTIQKFSNFLREHGSKLQELVFEDKYFENKYVIDIYVSMYVDGNFRPKQPPFDPRPIIIDAIRNSGWTQKFTKLKIFDCITYVNKCLTINYRDTFAQLEQLSIIIPLLDKWRKITINTRNKYNSANVISLQDRDQWNWMVNHLIDTYRHKPIIVKIHKDKK